MKSLPYLKPGEGTPYRPYPPPLPLAPTSQIMRNRKSKTVVCYCQCSWILLKESIFLKIPFCNEWLSEPNNRDQTRLSYFFSYVFSFLAEMLFTKRRNEHRTWSQVTEQSKGPAVCKKQKYLLHKLYNHDILVSFATVIMVVTQRLSPLLS